MRRRRFGAVVRVEVTPKMPKRMRKLLMRQLEVSEFDIYEVAGILGASDLMALVKLDRRDLKDAAVHARRSPRRSAPPTGRSSRRSARATSSSTTRTTRSAPSSS